ncbi:MAG TPA: PP2C family protein-serine/threonine phosphatase, partial [Anaerolineae bacterium]|nr:PP2C family protein-serine/threonine phosphatase [Anaerolineae bacterium]
EAATLTSLVKNTIKAHAYEDGTPALIMAKTNDLVARFSPLGNFITASFSILDMATGQLTYCSAGHPPAIIKRKAGGIDLLSKHSLIIGAFSKVNYRSGKAILRKGDTLIFYTDGITEARSNGDFFGEERLVEFIKGLGPTPAKELPQVIFNKVWQFTGGRLSDDIALLCLCIEG